MKKLLKRIICVAIACALLIPTYDVQAASTYLSNTYVTLKVDKTTTVKLKNNKKAVKWSTSNDNIEIVSKSKNKVKIKGIIAGSSKIIAKVGKKKYVCYVDVENQYNSKKAEDNIDSQSFVTKNGGVAIFKNNNDFPVSINAKMVFYDSKGNVIDYAYGVSYCVGTDRETAIQFYVTDYMYSGSYSAELTYDVTKSYYTDLGTGIDFVSNMSESGLMVTATNNSGYTIDTMNAVAVFYDASGNPIGTDEQYFSLSKNGSSDIQAFSYPYDEEYDVIHPASYKIFVSDAFNYGF